jgi:Ran GTPase-activating protein (RanGAP) involved in mRNA processing and transport
MGNSMQMRRLTSINWMGNSLNQEGAEAIASWDAPMLRSLDLSANHLGATGALHLRRSAWIKNLRHLNLAENNLREEGIGHLAPALGALLKTLALDSNLLEASSGQFLAESPARERLVILELSRNRIGNRGWELLSEKPWPKLRHLGLMLNDVGPDAPPPSRDKFPRLSGIRLARPPEDDSIAS